MVDDDDTTNLINTLFIRQVDQSVQVNVTVNGKDAIDFLSNNDQENLLPCLLILDTNMPVMNGWEFLEAFDKKFDQKFKKQVTIVMMTSLDIKTALEKAMSSPNVSDTAQKPLSDVKFRALMNKHF